MTTIMAKVGAKGKRVCERASAAGAVAVVSAPADAVAVMGAPADALKVAGAPANAVAGMGAPTNATAAVDRKADAAAVVGAPADATVVAGSQAAAEAVVEAGGGGDGSEVCITTRVSAVSQKAPVYIGYLTAAGAIYQDTFAK